MYDNIMGLETRQDGYCLMVDTNPEHRLVRAICSLHAVTSRSTGEGTICCCFFNSWTCVFTFHPPPSPYRSSTPQSFVSSLFITPSSKKLWYGILLFHCWLPIDHKYYEDRRMVKVGVRLTLLVMIGILFTEKNGIAFRLLNNLNGLSLIRSFPVS